MRLLYDQRKEQPEKGTIEFMGKRIDREDTDWIVKMGISYIPRVGRYFRNSGERKYPHGGVCAKNQKRD